MLNNLTAFENILGKGEIARNKQFLFFPQCFLLNQIIVSPFVHIFYIISLFAAELEDPKIGIRGKALKVNFSESLKVGDCVGNGISLFCRKCTLLAAMANLRINMN